MSTRGVYGFRVDGKDFVTYNHSDSYPRGLGEGILKDFKVLFKSHTINELKNKVRQIKLVDNHIKPAEQDIKNLALYTDLDVSNRSTKDWYCLTYKLQGDLLAHIQSGYMLDEAKFLLRSLYCEWAYIINLDEETFEAYKGFIRSKGDGRYDSRQSLGSESSEYFGVKLIIAYPFFLAISLESITALIDFFV